MPRMQERQQHRATRPAATPTGPSSARAAYVILRRNPLLWGSRARGVEAALVSDGRRLMVLGRGGVAATLRREAEHRWQHHSSGPVERLGRFCAGLGMSIYERQGPVADPSPLPVLAERLAERYQWPLKGPAGSRPPTRKRGPILVESSD